MQSCVCTTFLTSSLFANQHPCNASLNHHKILHIDGGKIWTVCWVREKPEFQFLNHFNGYCCCIRSRVVMMWTTTSISIPLCLLWIVEFQLLYKHRTITCTPESLCIILVVLKNEPTEVPKLHQHYFASTLALLNFLILDDKLYFNSKHWCLHAGSQQCTDILSPVKIHCKKSLFVIWLQKLHAHFYACLCMLICKLLWHPPCTNSVTPEIHSWCPIYQLFNIICHFVKWSDNPSRLHQQCLFCHFGTFPPTGTPSLTYHFIPYCAEHSSVKLWPFYPFWPQKSQCSTLLNNDTIQKWSQHIYTITAWASPKVTATLYHTYVWLSMWYAWCPQGCCLTNYQDFTCKLPLFSPHTSQEMALNYTNGPAIATALTFCYWIYCNGDVLTVWQNTSSCGNI